MQKLHTLTSLSFEIMVAIQLRFFSCFYTNLYTFFQVRLVGREDFDQDFIEIDVPINALSFRNLVEIICEEFSVNPKTIVKLRKLPNTKLRRDVEVQRLEDYQELEVEVLDI